MKDDIEIPKEFLDVYKVLEVGAEKYGSNSWLKGMHFNRKDNCDSMFHHLAEHYSGVEADAESGLDPLLHIACRALMMHTLKERGLLKSTTKHDKVG